MFESIVGIAFSSALFGTAIAFTGLSLERLNRNSGAWRHCVLNSAVFSIFLGVPLLAAISPWLPAIDNLNPFGIGQSPHTPSSITFDVASREAITQTEPIQASLPQESQLAFLAKIWQQGTWSPLVGRAFIFIWLAGLIYGLIRLINAALFMNRVMVKSRYPNGQVSARLQRVLSNSSCSSRHCVRLSDAIPVPCLAGLLNPRVLLPNQLLDKLDDNELRQILLHEFAHRKRNDQFTIMVNQIVLVIFWWNPVVRTLHQRLAQSCEEVCDNYVLVKFDPASYSATLCKLAGLITNWPGRAVETSPCLMSGRWLLEHRIRGILADSRDLRVRVEKRYAFPVTLIFAGALSLAILVGNPVYAFFTNQHLKSEEDVPTLAEATIRDLPKEIAATPLHLVGQADSEDTLKIMSGKRVVLLLEGKDADRAKLRFHKQGWSVAIDGQRVFLLVLEGFEQAASDSQPFRLGAPYGYSRTDQGDTCVRLTRKPANKEDVSFKPTGFVSSAAQNGSTYTIRF